MGGDLLAAARGKLLQGFLGHGQHAAGAAGAIVEQIGSGLDLVGDRQKDELGHQSHGVPRGPVLASLLVVLFVEAAHQFLEDRAHGVVVQARAEDGAISAPDRIGTQIDVGGGEFLDQSAKRVGLGQARDLVAELEAIEDVLHVGGKTVEPGAEVGFELLAAGSRAKVTQGERRNVVEGLAGRLAQSGILLDDAGGIERSLHFENGRLAIFEHGIETAQHCHRQDHVAVLAAHVKVAQHIVRDAPDVVRDPAEAAVAHRISPTNFSLYSSSSATVILLLGIVGPSIWIVRAVFCPTLRKVERHGRHQTPSKYSETASASHRSQKQRWPRKIGQRYKWILSLI